MPESRHRRRRGSSAQQRGGAYAGSSTAATQRKRKTNYLYLGVSATIAVLVIAGFALGSVNLGQGGPGTQRGDSDSYVEGVGVQQDIMPTANHIPETQNVDNYNTNPPTSGDHWAVQQGPCGFYPAGLPNERIVHNLEHGNIVVSYNLTDPAQVEELENVVNDIGLSANWGITRYYDQIEPGTVAVAAWGVLDTMQGIDAERIKKFFDAYAGNLGPERIVC